jgi:hypothetical protein
MGTLIFIIVAVIILFVTIYFSLKSKIRCPKCKSNLIVQTGNKKYEEDPPLALAGSPDSYNSIEYKCSKCGYIF